MKNILSITFLSLMAVFFASCNKGPGEGGRGTIQGHVKQVLHSDDDFLLTVDTIDAAKTDVFIVYGDNPYFGDDAETGYDGFYRFEYLTSGEYTIYSYSTLPSGEKEAVSQTVTLKGNSVEEVPTIYIHSGKAYGTSIITGMVIAAYYDGNNWLSEGPAYEQRVYIRKKNETTHFDDVRVGVDGIYVFQKIQPGDYEVYTFTEDNNSLPTPLIQEVSVTEAGKIIELDDFVIRKNL